MILLITLLSTGCATTKEILTSKTCPVKKIDFYDYLIDTNGDGDKDAVLLKENDLRNVLSTIRILEQCSGL